MTDRRWKRKCPSLSSPDTELILRFIIIIIIIIIEIVLKAHKHIHTYVKLKK